MLYPELWPGARSPIGEIQPKPCDDLGEGVRLNRILIEDPGHERFCLLVQETR